MSAKRDLTCFELILIAVAAAIVAGFTAFIIYDAVTLGR